MTRGFSLWLDVLRVLATVTVVVSHWAYPRFTNGDFAIIRDWNLGSDAVIIFFVISGLVIAYAGERDGNAQTFVFHRATRLLSVILPALLLTFAFDRIGVAIRPSSYPPQFYHTHGFGEFMLRGLTFSNEFRLLERLRLGTNGPLWSLSYEAAYYALFAAAMFLTGARRYVYLLAMVMLFGLPILLLMPAWLMGVWVWRKVKAQEWIPQSRAIAWGLALGAPAIYAMLIGMGVPADLRAATASALGVADARQVIGFSDEFIWNAMIGLLTVAHLFGMARLWQDRQQEGRWIRWAAGASFSLYVTHYPALHLLDAILPEPMIGRYVILLIGPFIVGLAFAQVFERHLGAVRAAFGRFRPARA